MTVTELIAQLEQQPGHLQVVLSSDAEGNDFRTLGASMEEAMLHEGEVYWLDDNDDDFSVNALVLWPNW